MITGAQLWRIVPFGRITEHSAGGKKLRRNVAAVDVCRNMESKASATRPNKLQTVNPRCLRYSIFILRMLSALGGISCKS